MKNKTLYLTAAIILTAFSLVAQSKNDTMLVDATTLNTKALRPSSNRYLIYGKAGKDSSRKNVFFCTRNIEFTQYNGKEVIVITQIWEDKDTIIHTAKSICDKQSFAPIYQEGWWNKWGSSTFDFANKSASILGMPLSDEDTARSRKNPWNAFKVACNQYVLNWHLDMEVFPTLPFKAGKTFLLPFYDPGSPAPRNEAYTVSGSDVLIGFNDEKIDCWLLSHNSRSNKELVWVSKKTKEVLKLEQEFNGKTYRYKVKLGFSI